MPPLPAGLTPHHLRHTFASILVSCGEDPASVMAQLGHADAHFTLRVYAHQMRRWPDERQRLQCYVNDLADAPSTVAQMPLTAWTRPRSSTGPDAFGYQGIRAVQALKFPSA